MGDLHMWLTFGVITLTILGFAAERWSIEGVSLAAIATLLAVFTLVPQSSPDPVQAADLPILLQIHLLTIQSAL